MNPTSISANRQFRAGAVLLVVLAVGCTAPQESSQAPRLTAPATVGPFLAEHMSAERHAHGAVIAPAGDLTYFVSSDLGYAEFDIQVVRIQDDGFSAPSLMSFDTAHSDHAPAFFPSAQGLCFSSTRPLPGETESPGWRIWSVGADPGDGETTDMGEPRPLALDDTGLDVLSHSSLTAVGDLYFHGLREGTQVEYDIYVAAAAEGGFAKPARLGPEVNSPGIEVTPFVDPGGRYLLFAAYERPDGFGGGDLYVSLSDGEGGWLPAQNLGPEVNGPGEESNPFVSTDGSALLFSSSRSDMPGRTDLNLFWIATSSLDPLAP